MHLLPRVPAARSHASSDTRETFALTLGALIAHVAWLAVLTAGGAA